MKRVIVNPYHLKEEEIEKRVCRVKTLIVGSDKNVLLCNLNGNYSFVGGHREKNETNLECLKREVLEETGIELKNEYDLFLEIVKYEKTHFGVQQPCKSETYFYLILTDEKYNLKNLNLDEKEKQGNFNLIYVPIDEVESLLRASESYGRKSELYEEMIYVIEECKSLLNSNAEEKGHGKIF